MGPIASARCSGAHHEIAGDPAARFAHPYGEAAVTAPAELAALLIGLERELHDPAIRRDRARLHALLDAEYVEVGRSGRVYTKAAMVAHLAEEKPVQIHADDFHVALLAADVALVTYRSAHIQHDGTRVDHARRCSVWRRAQQGWQVRYHQGTPVPAGDTGAQVR